MGVDMTGAGPKMDYKEHQRTYSLFIKGTIVLTALSVLTLALLGIFVA